MAEDRGHRSGRDLRHHDQPLLRDDGADGGNLGYDVQFVLDANATFDREDLDGQIIPAEEIARVTAANLQGEFADVVTTARALAS